MNKNMLLVLTTVDLGRSTHPAPCTSSDSEKCRPVAPTVELSVSSPLYIKRKPLYTGLRSTHLSLESYKAAFRVDHNCRPVYSSLYKGRHHAK